MSQSQSLRSFRDFEHSGWQMVAGPYHKYFGSLTSQTIDPLLAGLSSQGNLELAGKEVLDIASGPGYVAARAYELGATVTGVDFSAQMVLNASGLYPGIRFVEGDAEKLSFPAASFDAVSMNFGMLHLDQPELAVREAARVLRKGGRFAFSVWAMPDQAVAFGLALKAIETHGDKSVALPAGPPFFRFSDPQESKRVMEEAGFADISTTVVQLVWRLERRDDLFEAFFQGTPRTGGLLRAQKAEALSSIKEALLTSADVYRSGQGLEIPMAALVASGSRI